MTTDTPLHDVIVVGGGLAGLTLALQLKRRFADIDVVVLERAAHPVPEACHKVGESTVEIGAHYLQHVLGLEQHLQTGQLKKFGFRFFFSDGRRDIEHVTELGASRPLAVPAWQIDRGIFENFLAAEVQRQGVVFHDRAVVRRIELADDDTSAHATSLHAVSWQDAGGTTHDARARWVIDASGRAALLKRKLGLARPNAHGAHAVWFRIGARITLDDWSDDPAWQARCVTPTRWLSTNHLVGDGYWVWLIPLASGSHSVGIVADPRLQPLERMNTFERAMEWLAKRQPRLFDDLQSKRHLLQDFAFFRTFSYDCEQVFSAQRWALAGEAGRFLDPFYSPGTDFIAIGNTFITELVALDRAGQPIAAHAHVYEQMFRSFYDNTLTLYVDQYALFGDPEVLPHKVMWDYTYYWSVLAPLFFQGRLADLATLAHLRGALQACQQLNADMQAFLRAWGGVSARRDQGGLIDQAALPWFAELNRRLTDRLDDAAFIARIGEAVIDMQALAQRLVAKACADYPALAHSASAPRLREGSAAGTSARQSEAVL